MDRRRRRAVVSLDDTAVPKSNSPTPLPRTAPDGAFSLSAESNDYEASLSIIGEFNTAEDFCRYLNLLKPPSKLKRNSKHYLFKSGIKPMWEDEANANGGKRIWVMKNTPRLLDQCWSRLATLVGEELEEGDNIVGQSSVSGARLIGPRFGRGARTTWRGSIAFGRSSSSLSTARSQGIGLEFQYNADDGPQPNKFLSI